MRRLEELAFHKTPIGDLVLRRRPEPLLKNADVYEVKLGEEFLMSSLFTEGEEQLADIGLAGLTGDLHVIVGGLGLGYTAAQALNNVNIKSLTVIEAFEEVIGWHHSHLVPNGKVLSSDSRCKLVKGDFFELASTGFDRDNPERLYDAVLLDIDHTPDHYLATPNAEFYTDEGLAQLSKQIKDQGVFALWSDDPVDEQFCDKLRKVFGEAVGHDVEFANPYTSGTSVNAVYVAKKVAREC